jgi:hypothetical protein|tara:strand:+ start:150 stop:380 length:231 start_codon:yes stop_codon:yes gene_type:complete
MPSTQAKATSPVQKFDKILLELQKLREENEKLKAERDDYREKYYVQEKISWNAIISQSKLLDALDNVPYAEVVSVE